MQGRYFTDPYPAAGRRKTGIRRILPVAALQDMRNHKATGRCLNTGRKIDFATNSILKKNFTSVTITAAVFHGIMLW